MIFSQQFLDSIFHVSYIDQLYFVLYKNIQTHFAAVKDTVQKIYKPVIRAASKPSSEINLHSPPLIYK